MIVYSFSLVGGAATASLLLAGFKLNLKVATDALKPSPEKKPTPGAKPSAKLSKKEAAAKVRFEHKATIADDALLEPDVKLRQYVRDQVAKGADKEGLSKRLVGVGWDASVIEKLIAEFAGQASLLTTEEERLVAFVREKFALGFTEEALTKSLVKAGWKQEVIEKVFAAAKQA